MIIPQIKKILDKENKEKKDYLLLIGYFWYQYEHYPTAENIAIYDKLAENFEKKFGKSVESLSIFRNKAQTLGF